MAVGANITYAKGHHLRAKFMKDLMSNTTGDRTDGGWRKPNICYKSSDTAPQDDTSADFPQNVGDICLHYNAAGVFQAAYICTDGDLSSTCTWTALA
jgi:hypothetical protein